MSLHCMQARPVSQQQPGMHMRSLGARMLTGGALHPTAPVLQAELFRLEGLFHMALGDGDAADRSFSTALALWPQLAAAWLSWGEFCDSKARRSSCTLLRSWHSAQHAFGSILHAGRRMRACTSVFHQCMHASAAQGPALSDEQHSGSGRGRA